MDTEIVKVNGKDLSDIEISQINSSVFREWKVEPYTREILSDTLFFFLKKKDEILAMGGLKDTHPVIFDEVSFSILGVVEVVSNVKGEGHGKSVVSAMRKYLVENGKTGIGFCMLKNVGFYEKCGFKIEHNSSQRFVYTKGEERIINQDGQVIFYQDGVDQFMEKVLSNPNLEVSIPTDGLW